ncbi:MAG TPA: ECF transporter S component [Lachnospiraceae bacterium]|nr:ECF transporter S component [Lachnospiraceae bacterium]
MSIFIQQEDGYYSLGTTSYYILIVVLLAAFILSAVIVNRKQKSGRFSPKRLAICGVSIALGFVLSFIKVEMPYGGSATAFSMFCVCIIGYFYGIKAGILSAFAYSILQFFQTGSSFMLSPIQVCCDYFFAFTALGITGFFYKKKDKFILGYFISILIRGMFHAIGGYLYWMDYMPENFPQSLAFLYPVIYNYSYILIEGVITILIIKIPAVSKMFKRLQVMAAEK